MVRKALIRPGVNAEGEEGFRGDPDKNRVPPPRRRNGGGGNSATTPSDSAPSDEIVSDTSSSSSSEDDDADEDYLGESPTAAVRRNKKRRAEDGTHQRLPPSLVAPTGKHRAPHIPPRRAIIPNASDLANSELFDAILKDRQSFTKDCILQWSRKLNDASGGGCATTAGGTIDSVVLEIINLTLEAAGLPGDFVKLPDTEGKTPEEVVAEILGTLDMKGIPLCAKFPLKSNQKRLAHFPSSFRRFFTDFAATLDEEVVTEPSFHDPLFSWILTLSHHRVRNFRHSATVVGLAYCEGVIEQLVQRKLEASRFREQSSMTTTMTSDESSSALKARLADRTRKVERLTEIVEDIVRPLMGVRWRDACPEIRRVVFESLYQWSKKLPDFFLPTPTRSRLLGWALYDRNPVTRTMAAQGLLSLLESDDTFAPLNTDASVQADKDAAGATPTPPKRGITFIASFKKRLLELPEDVVLPVRTAGVKILHELAKRDILADNEIEKVVDNVWRCPSLLEERRGLFGAFAEPASSAARPPPPSFDSASLAAFRGALAAFINFAIFSVSIIRDDSELTTTCGSRKGGDDNGGTPETLSQQTLDLRAILEFVIEFAEELLLIIDRFVSAFWYQAPALRAPQILIDFLVVGEGSDLGGCGGPLEEKHRRPLLALLLSVLRHMQMQVALDETASSEGGTNAATSKLRTTLEEACVLALSYLPDIIRLCKIEPQTFVLASQLSAFCASVVVGERHDSSSAGRTEDLMPRPGKAVDCLKQRVNFKKNIKFLCDTFQATATILPALEPLGNALFSLTRHASPSEAHIAEDMVSKICKKVQVAAHKILKCNANPKDTEENLDDLKGLLRRLVIIAKLADFNPFLDGAKDLAGTLLDLCRSRLLFLSPPDKKWSQIHDVPVVMLSLECLTLALFHYWSDLSDISAKQTAGSRAHLGGADAPEEETLENCDKQTDKTGGDDASRKMGKAGRKRRKSATLSGNRSEGDNALIGRSVKRRRQSKDNAADGGEPGELSAPAEQLPLLMDKVRGFARGLRGVAVEVLSSRSSTKAWYLMRYRAASTLLQAARPLERCVEGIGGLGEGDEENHAPNWEPTSHDAPSEAEVSQLVSYFKESAADLENVLSDDTTTTSLNYVLCETLRDVTESVLAPYVPVVTEVYDGVMTPEEAEELRASTSSVEDADGAKSEGGPPRQYKYRQFVLYRVTNFLRLLESSQSRALLASSLTGLALCLVHHDRHDLDARVARVAAAVLLLDGGRASLLLQILRQTAVAVAGDARRRVLLKAIVAGLLRVLPHNCLAANVPDVISCLIEASKLEPPALSALVLPGLAPLLLKLPGESKDHALSRLETEVENGKKDGSLGAAAADLLRNTLLSGAPASTRKARGALMMIEQEKSALEGKAVEDDAPVVVVD